jgi:hypothetical protein
MTIPDQTYFKLVRVLTDQHVGSDYFAVMGRDWVENRIQVALCEADVYPASSEDGAVLEHHSAVVGIAAAAQLN